MSVLRYLGYAMITLGILLSITIIGAAIGVPMMLFGLLFVAVGRKRTPIIIQVQQPGQSRDN